MEELVVPLVDYVIMGFITLFLVLTTGLFFFIALSQERLMDRYRLKYGFDREIERKECSKEHTESKLDKREQRFKRRVFKD